MRLTPEPPDTFMCAHGGFKYALGRCAELVRVLVRRERGEDRNRVLVGSKTARRMKRWPRAVDFVFRDAVRILATVPERAAVELSGRVPITLRIHEPHRASDRRVGAPAGPEQVVATIDADLACDRTVDEHEHG